VTEVVAEKSVLNEAAPGWHAALKLDFRHSAWRTIVHRQSVGPLTMQRAFYPENEVCHVYLLHPPGGIAGGDSLSLDVSVEPGAQALITTPGATRFYRCQHKSATMIQNLSISGGSLEWFPQETLFFSECAAQSTTRVALDSQASFIGWDIQCFGRPASKDYFTAGSITSRFQIYRDEIPLFADRLQIRSITDLSRQTGVRGHQVNAMMVATPCPPPLLDMIRQNLRDVPNAAATLLPGIVIIRYLGDCAETARSLFVNLWSLLRPQLLSRPACEPRIWAT